MTKLLERLVDLLPFIIGMLLPTLAYRLSRSAEKRPEKPKPLTAKTWTLPVSTIRWEDIERHQNRISPDEVLARIQNEQPLVRLGNDPPYAEEIDPQPNFFTRLEQALPEGTVHVVLNPSAGTRETFYRSGPYWLRLRETRDQERQAPRRWRFHELELRDTTRIAIRIPLRADEIPLQIEGNASIGVMEDAEAHVLLPPAYSFIITRCACRLDREANTAPEVHAPVESSALARLSRPRDFDEKTTTAFHGLIRWLSNYANILTRDQSEIVASLMTEFKAHMFNLDPKKPD